ncbi:MAG: TRAP transporter small permease [Desulfomonile tiedjei]|nr:TRAP transporter small permease [Desulfomonile tiedjei]
MESKDSGFWEKLEAVAKVLSKVTGLIGALCLLAAAVVTTEGVLVRKILGWSTTWQVELSVFLLMYACFVGAAYGQLGEHHLNIDLLIIYLSPRVRETLLAVTGVLSCIICVIIAWYAWPMWWEAVVRNDHSESLWGPPLWIPYIFLPLGVTLVFLQSLVQVRSRIVLLRAGTFDKQAARTELKDITITADAGPGKRGEHE